eukprot:CAMPEP_0174254154 /NCGR_PEP_ID=MMETSP0439-20130205/3505_1 /TAXON_ID=0 /ORGANISM="Stereomyxa ramosa, Strain Chinc5" /LENGTH=246 /DNA_ID=CAMNT_0015335595 /DNA_START=512 /DNA_END=1252 /DNA_ORIENTATION=+
MVKDLKKEVTRLKRGSKTPERSPSNTTSTLFSTSPRANTQQGGPSFGTFASFSTSPGANTQGTSGFGAGLFSPGDRDVQVTTQPPFGSSSVRVNPPSRPSAGSQAPAFGSGLSNASPSGPSGPSFGGGTVLGSSPPPPQGSQGSSFGGSFGLPYGGSQTTGSSGFGGSYGGGLVSSSPSQSLFGVISPRADEGSRLSPYDSSSQKGVRFAPLVSEEGNQLYSIVGNRQLASFSYEELRYHHYMRRT